MRFRNGKTTKNGLAVAALTNGQSNPDGSLNDRELRWLARRAKGGFGIVTSAAMHVQEGGKGWQGEWGCFDDSQIDGFRRAATAVQAEGALFIGQLFHGGMRADDTLIEGPARSAVDYEYKHRGGTRPVKALSEPEIHQLIEDFVAAAKRMDVAGADGIEIHGAHGYILTQFLCPDLNKRTDRWGGSFENRSRLTREVTRQIRAAVSPGFLVGVRLSPEPGFEKAGWNMDPDEVVELARLLCEDGVDFISVSLFRHAPSHVTSKHKKRGDSKPMVQVFREACPKDVVIMACGKVTSGADVRALTALGVEIVVMGQSAISTPDFPRQVQSNPDFAVSVFPPYAQDFLASVDVSPPFIDFMVAAGWAQAKL